MGVRYIAGEWVQVRRLGRWRLAVVLRCYGQQTLVSEKPARGEQFVTTYKAPLAITRKYEP